jgi:hypothetical protein
LRYQKGNLTLTINRPKQGLSLHNLICRSSFKQWPAFRHEVITEESDGIVTVSSQTAYPGAEVGAKMINTNHMQERNHSETRKRLIELYTGEYG